MAYNHYDDRRDRSPDYNRSDRSGGHQDERGFFERAGDEIASWFGDDDAERRRSDDERMNRDRDMNRDYDRNGFGRGRDYDRGYGLTRDYRSTNPRSSREYERMGYGGQDRDYSSRNRMGSSQNSDYMSPTGPSFGYGGRYGTGTDSGYGSGGYGSEYRGDEYDRDREKGRGRDSDRERSRDYRPMTGDYGRSQSPWGRDDYRNTSYAGADWNSGRDNDRHYHAWRQRQMDELDSDYDRYHRERQEKFENDFGSWRQNRQDKRGRLGSIHEHMDVVGSDGETVGKVDCVKGDHVILTKDDSPDNRHHSIDCSMIETVEGDQVRLDVPAEEAKSRWEDADNRGFFGRDNDQREREPDHEPNLNRAFSGTYDNENKNES
jgi:hypothetical protein